MNSDNEVVVKKTVSISSELWDYVTWKAKRDNHDNHSRVVREAIEPICKKDRAYKSFLRLASKINPIKKKAHAPQMAA